MALQIGATAPDFEAQTTEGKIKFHDWIGSNWALLFSHPKDFTPVCTTELGVLAKLKPEFDKRGVKLMGLSVDPVDKHSKWSEDIKETQGAAPNYPMIGDTDYNVSKLYDMLPASTSGDVATRTAADNMTVRNVFIIGPDKKIKLVLVYPMTTGRNFQEILRVIDSLQMTAKHRVATPATGNRGKTSSSLAPSATTRPRRSIRRAGSHRSRISGSCRSPNDTPKACHPGARSEPGISRFRVRCFASPRNDGELNSRHQPVRHNQPGGRRDRRHHSAPGDIDDRDRPAPVPQQR